MKKCKTKNLSLNFVWLENFDSQFKKKKLKKKINKKKNKKKKKKKINKYDINTHIDVIFQPIRKTRFVLSILIQMLYYNQSENWICAKFTVIYNLTF